MIYYVVKYMDEQNNIKLISDLGEEEKESVIEIFEELKNGECYNVKF